MITIFNMIFLIKFKMNKIYLLSDKLKANKLTTLLKLRLILKIINKKYHQNNTIFKNLIRNRQKHFPKPILKSILIYKKQMKQNCKKVTA